MAYQKLQPTQAADVILSDTINPIDPSRPNKVSGTADGDFTDFLNDISVATESYTGTPGVVEADKLNVTTSAYTQVTAVDSDKILSLSDDIFGSLSDDYAVYTSGFFALGIYIGDIVWNSTSKSYALVTAVYSAQLALSSDIFNAADKFAVYSNTSLMNSNTDAFVVYVGGGASSNIDIKVTTAAGNDIVFSGFPKGGFLPVQCLRVWTTGTAATNVVALW